MGWTSLPFLPLINIPADAGPGRGRRSDHPALANSRILLALIPRAQRHVHPGGHLELVCDPPRIVPVLERFLGHDAHKNPAAYWYRGEARPLWTFLPSSPHSHRVLEAAMDELRVESATHSAPTTSSSRTS